MCGARTIVRDAPRTLRGRARYDGRVGSARAKLAVDEVAQSPRQPPRLHCRQQTGRGSRVTAKGASSRQNVGKPDLRRFLRRRDRVREIGVGIQGPSPPGPDLRWPALANHQACKDTMKKYGRRPGTTRREAVSFCMPVPKSRRFAHTGGAPSPYGALANMAEYCVASMA